MLSVFNVCLLISYTTQLLPGYSAVILVFFYIKHEIDILGNISRLVIRDREKIRCRTKIRDAILTCAQKLT